MYDTNQVEVVQRDCEWSFFDNVKGNNDTLFNTLWVFWKITINHSEGSRYLKLHYHHVQEGLGLIPVPCILKMKLVPPSLPRSSCVSSSFWFIL